MRQVKERPIIFSGATVRAILAGTKTQTRRVANVSVVSNVKLLKLRGCSCYIDFDDVPGLSWRPFGGSPTVPLPQSEIDARGFYGAPGSQFWVREAWRVLHSEADICYRADDATKRFLDHETWFDGDWKATKNHNWRPSIHMPRWASRIDLELTAVRVERVQEISEADAIAEGVDRAVNDMTSARYGGHPYCSGFGALWDQINGKREGCSWEANPYVWALSFRRLHP